MTNHIGFFTIEALNSIYMTTINNINNIATKQKCENEIKIN
jgi:lactate dehydrogenase-like 2-hydroxyacid dehydrogenase